MEKFKALRDLLEAFDFDEDDARDDARYEAGTNYSERFNDTEEVEDTFQLSIDGHQLSFSFTADQDVVVDGEEATFNDPAWAEVVEYGEITDVKSITDFVFDGKSYDTDELILVHSSASDIEQSLKLYAKELAEMLGIDIQVAAKIAKSFATYLRNCERMN